MITNFLLLYCYPAITRRKKKEVSQFPSFFHSGKMPAPRVRDGSIYVYVIYECVCSSDHPRRQGRCQLTTQIPNCSEKRCGN